jgi:hypothetical protein
MFPQFLERKGFVFLYSNGIQVHVAGHFHEIVIGINQKGFVASLIKMAHSLMDAVEIEGIGYVEVAHEFLEIGQGGLDDEVEVVGHEDKGQHVHLVDLRGSGQKVQKRLSIGVISNNILSGITAAGYMVVCVLISDSQRSGHGGILEEKRLAVKNKDLTPLATQPVKYSVFWEICSLY